MKNFKTLVESVGTKGTEFVSLNNYEAKGNGEIANHTINTGISVMNAKKKDFQTLQNCTNADLVEMNKIKKFGVKTYREAYFELLKSAEQNLNPDVKKRTNQSQATTNAFIQLTPAIKFCENTKEFHLFGQAIAKTIVQDAPIKYDDNGNEIVKKPTNSAPKTLAKKMIKKTLDLRSEKYRTFILNNVENVKSKGETIKLNNVESASHNQNILVINLIFLN